MDNQIDQLLNEIAELKEKMAELESRIDDEVSSLEEKIDDLDASFQDSITDCLVEFGNAQDFSDLDEIPTYTDENVIILHRNRFRTADLAHACRPSEQSSVIWLLHKYSQDLTPSNLLRAVTNSNKGAYIFLKDIVFSVSDEFERIILDAITEEKVYFAIFTNSIDKIPQSIRDRMRVIE